MKNFNMYWGQSSPFFFTSEKGLFDIDKTILDYLSEHRHLGSTLERRNKMGFIGVSDFMDDPKQNADKLFNGVAYYFFKTKQQRDQFLLILE